MTDGPAPDPAALLALARPIAEEVAAGLVLALDGDDRASAVTAKSTGTDLVTEMDTWAEQVITERILTARPHDAVRGEEGVDVAGTSGVSWSIDPIDGTVNFVHGLPGFCVSIAAEWQGEAVAGVVVSPLHHDVFTAVRGGAASTKPDDGGSPSRPLHRAPASVAIRAPAAWSHGLRPTSQ